MVLYLIAVPYEWCANSQDPDVSMLVSQLNLWGALLFVMESLLDLAWGLKRSILESRLREDKAQLAHVSGRPSAEPESALCMPWLDKVHWDMWAAFWFLIPSLIRVDRFYIMGLAL